MLPETPFKGRSHIFSDLLFLPFFLSCLIYWRFDSSSGEAQRKETQLHGEPEDAGRSKKEFEENYWAVLNRHSAKTCTSLIDLFEPRPSMDKNENKLKVLNTKGVSTNKHLLCSKLHNPYRYNKIHPTQEAPRLFLFVQPLDKTCSKTNCNT